MAKPVATRDKTFLDPAFLIPDGMESEFSYAEQVVGDDTIADESLFDSDIFVIDENDDTIDDEGTLPIPDAPVIVSQTIRASIGGAQVVDVVVEVNDIEGVDDIELRYTKI